MCLLAPAGALIVMMRNLRSTASHFYLQYTQLTQQTIKRNNHTNSTVLLAKTCDNVNGLKTLSKYTQASMLQLRKHLPHLRSAPQWQDVYIVWHYLPLLYLYLYLFSNYMFHGNFTFIWLVQNSNPANWAVMFKYSMFALLPQPESQRNWFQIILRFRNGIILSTQYQNHYWVG